MDLDLRKTATDAAYIAVGAGVLGFQQAQVRRREARAKLDQRAHDVKAAADALQSKVSAFGTDLAGRAVELKDKAASARTVDARHLVEPVLDELKGRVEPILEQLKGIHLPERVHTLPERVQALPEQLKTVRLPEPVHALPDQLAKAAATGRERIRDLRGAPAPKAAAPKPAAGPSATGTTNA